MHGRKDLRLKLQLLRHHIIPEPRSLDRGMNLNMGVSFYDDMAVMPGYPPRSGLLMGPPPLHHRPHPSGAVTGTSASLDPRPLTTAALIDPPVPPMPPLPPPQVSVARWQNLIPSYPWIVPGWRAWGHNQRKGRDQRSVAEP